MRRILALLAFLLAIGAQAQNLSVTDIQGFVGYDHRPLHGTSRDVACRLNFDYGEKAKADFGLRYSWAGVLSGELGIYFPLHVTENHKFYLKSDYLYRYFCSQGITEFSGSLLGNYCSSHWDIQLGLANRYYCDNLWSVHQQNNTILEPMSFCYLFEYRINKLDSKWNVSFMLGNIDYFLIDRASRFRSSVVVHYKHQRQRYSLQLGCHPAGVLNLASVYDGVWMRLAINHEFKQQ